MSDIQNLIGALFSDALSAISSPIASSGGALLAQALSAVMERRKAAAREILLDEIRHSRSSPTTDHIDESVSILYRYWRAAQEGAGRLNLRLLASVFAGQVRERAIIADDFLYYADLLSSLRRDEIILLGTFLRCSTNIDGTPRMSDDPMTEACTELVPSVFDTHADYFATLGALLRTGLVSTHATGGSIGSGPRLVYQVTNILRELNRLAEIEGVVERDRANVDPLI